MTLCPIALAVGCRKCPIFAVCPVKGIIGDYKKESAKEADAPVKPAAKEGQAPVRRAAAGAKTSAKRRAKRRR